MKFEAEKDADGNYNPSTVKISFKRGAIYKKLCTYLKAKDLQEKLENDTESFADETQHKEAIKAMESDIEKIKIHLMDDSMIVKKGTAGIAAKVFPQ